MTKVFHDQGPNLKPKPKIPIISGLPPEPCTNWHKVNKIKELNLWLNDSCRTGFQYKGYWHQ